MSEQGDVVIPVQPETSAPAAPELAPVATAPVATPEEKGPVPYDRFHQVNDEKNAAKEQLQQTQMELDYYRGQVQNWQNQQAQPGAQPTPSPAMPVALQPGALSDEVLEMMAQQNPESASWLKIIQAKARQEARQEADPIRAEVKQLREERELERQQTAAASENQRRSSILSSLWREAQAATPIPDIPGFTPEQKNALMETVGIAVEARVKAQLESNPQIMSLPEYLRIPKMGTLIKQALAGQIGLISGMVGKATPAPKPAVPGAQPTGTILPGAGAAVTQYNSLQDQLRAGVPLNTAMENYWEKLKEQLKT